MSELLQKKRRNHIVVQGNLERNEKGIVMQGFDRQFCRILYCPGCLEIYHDRNMPVNMEQCSHLMCQHCIKDQLIYQLKKNQSHDKPVSITCRKCNLNKKFQTLELFQKVSLINFEILSQVYKIRPKIAERGTKLYELPDEGEGMNILGVKKVVKSQQMQERIQMENLMIQQMNQAIRQQQRQNQFADELRQEVSCISCKFEFDDGSRKPIMLEQCSHKMCETCCDQFRDAQNMVVCNLCQQSRKVKQMQGMMQKWLVIQGKKKKRVLRNEMDMIKPQMMEISRAISAHHGVANEDNEEELKESISKAHKKLGTGIVKAKQLYGEDKDIFDELKQKRQFLRVNNIRLQLKESNQREIQCKFCTLVYNVLNKPLIVQSCPCFSIHQMCEQCFLSQCIIELKDPSHKSNFIQNCPQSFVNEVPLGALNYQSKEQLLEYYLFPEDQSLHRLPEYSHCFLKINTPLLHYIYRNHKELAFEAEEEIIQVNKDDYENDEEEFNFQDVEQLSVGYDPFPFQEQAQQDKLTMINKRRTMLQMNSENPFLDLEDIKPQVDDHFDGKQMDKLARKNNPVTKSHIFEATKMPSQIMVGIDDYKKCIQCECEFEKGERFPYMLNCNHNICNECLEIVYNQTQDQTVSYLCHKDRELSNFIKPSFYFEGAQVKETFQNFLKLSIGLNTGLMQILVYEKNQSAEMQKYIERRLSIFKKQRMRKLSSRLEEGDEEDEDLGNVEESKDFQMIGQEKPSPTGPGDDDILYDIECPICLLCYSEDNPPINLYCEQHPNHPFILCKNEIMYYVLKAGKDNNTIVSCPICHNDIEFKTQGLSDEAVLKMFEVNQPLLGKILGDQNLLEYIRNEEAQYNLH